MKKITIPGVREEYELICDVTGKPAVAKLVMTFGYGSSRDSQVLEMDISDEAVDEIIHFLQTKSPGIKLRDEGIFRSSCPLCGRG